MSPSHRQEAWQTCASFPTSCRRMRRTTFSFIAKLDEGENQWASELEQGITRPADELADQGPRGQVDFVPALSEAGALIVTDDDLNDATNNDFNPTTWPFG